MKLKMNRENGHRHIIAASAVVVSLIISMGCLAGPDDTAVTEKAPWDTLDNAWKVIENLEYAYNNMDIDLYMNCFRDDFEFWPPPEGWIPPDTCWGHNFELLCHQGIFSTATTIELILDGDSQSPWTGDSTGMSYQLSRIFSLKVYLDEAQTQGFCASGSALFICRPDSTGEWYIWYCYDLSNT